MPSSSTRRRGSWKIQEKSNPFHFIFNQYEHWKKTPLYVSNRNSTLLSPFTRAPLEKDPHPASKLRKKHLVAIWRSKVVSALVPPRRVDPNSSFQRQPHGFVKKNARPQDVEKSDVERMPRLNSCDALLTFLLGWAFRFPLTLASKFPHRFGIIRIFIIPFAKGWIKKRIWIMNPSIKQDMGHSDSAQLLQCSDFFT